MSRKFIALLVLFALIAACLAQEKPERCEDFQCPAGSACRETKVTADSPVVVVCEGIVCPTHYKPVCSDDGVTYANPCLLNVAGALYSYEGECVRPIPTLPSTTTTPPTSRPDTCPQHYVPVCGKDGKTYGNACLLGLAGVEFDYEGECRPTNCPLFYDPVCGVDGETYGNGCLLAAAGVEFDYEGECRPRNCPQFYVPVCGKDGKTYGNGCLLAAAGVEYDYDGECVDPTEVPTEAPTDRPDNCPQLYIPVCGVDGKTYGNACLLGLAGVEFDYEGECRPRNCPQFYVPVCGKDGKTYGNGCLLAAAGVEYDYDGECVDPTAEPTEVPTEAPTDRPDNCPQLYIPVCGVDGKTYGNACLLGLAGVELDYEGECRRACPQLYIPVCGKDGKTYGNGCLLAAAGVEFDYDGECVDPTAEPTPDPTDFPEVLCPELYDPVCAVSGKTYGNGCLLGEAGEEFDYAGECVPRGSESSESQAEN